MVSGFIDSLKLVLSDKYEISDSDYRALSDILLNKGLSDDALDSGLVQIIYLMIKYNHRFPISLMFLKELWEYENISFNFVKMLSGILKNGIVSLRKVKRETFLGSDNITKSNIEDVNQDLFVVVYGSPLFNEILNGFENILSKKENQITEGVALGTPKKISDVLVKTRKLLRNIKCNADVESYTNDDVLKSARLNLIISGTSDYTCGDSCILRVAKKYIKGKYVKGIEAYKEDKDSVFLGIDLDMSESSYLGLSDSIYSFIDELEIEGV